LRDFPREALSAHGIEAQHPDAFIFDLFRTSPSEVVAALRELRGDLVNPPMTASDLLGALTRQGLAATAEALSGFIDEL
jgi:hypothetical protein